MMMTIIINSIIFFILYVEPHAHTHITNIEELGKNFIKLIKLYLIIILEATTIKKTSNTVFKKQTKFLKKENQQQQYMPIIAYYYYYYI